MGGPVNRSSNDEKDVEEKNGDKSSDSLGQQRRYERLDRVLVDLKRNKLPSLQNPHAATPRESRLFLNKDKRPSPTDSGKELRSSISRRSSLRLPTKRKFRGNCKEVFRAAAPRWKRSGCRPSPRLRERQTNWLRCRDAKNQENLCFCGSEAHATEDTQPRPFSCAAPLSG